jgi:hypothetical protein
MNVCVYMNMYMFVYACLQTYINICINMYLSIYSYTFIDNFYVFFRTSYKKTGVFRVDIFEEKSLLGHLNK